MAVSKNKSLLGELRGGIGAMVLSESFGKTTARSKPGKRSKRSVNYKQSKQSIIFGMLSKFLAGTAPIFKLGYQLGKKPRMTAHNAGISKNFNHALITEGEKVWIDLEKLKFSHPIKKTQRAWQPVLSLVDKKIEITWGLNPEPQRCTQLDDRAVIVLQYHRWDRSYFHCFSKVALRSDLKYSLDVSGWLEGIELSWYMFMLSADKTLVSDTQYLGKVKVPDKVV